MKFVYAVFPKEEPALDAVRALEHSPDEREIATLAIHTDAIQNEELPSRGTFAKGSAIIGALLVGGCVGLFLTLLMSGVFARFGGPSHIVGSKPLDVVLLTLATAVFGGILAGLAGTAGDRGVVRKLERTLVDGHVLLTLEARNARAPVIVSQLQEFGALEAGSL